MPIYSNQILIVAAGLLTGALSGIALGSVFMKKKTLLKSEAAVHNTSFMFSGNLSQTNLVDAVQFLEIGMREGVLHIYCGRRKGYLIFKKGRIIDAFYRNRTGKEAVFSMLELSEGDFYFEPRDVQQLSLMSDSIMDIAFEYNEKISGDSESEFTL